MSVRNPRISSETKNLPITYSKLLNLGLHFLSTNFPNHPDYPAIQSLIRNCRSLTTIFHLLNNFDDFSAIMVDLSYTDELLKSLYTWKGKPKNLRIGLKYFNVLVNFIRDEDLRVPGVTWTSQFEVISERTRVQAEEEERVGYEDNQPHQEEGNMKREEVDKDMLATTGKDLFGGLEDLLSREEMERIEMRSVPIGARMLDSEDEEMVGWAEFGLETTGGCRRWEESDSFGIEG